MTNPQNFHFISIGGSVMHNLAIALKLSGHVVTGSDDEINEPSRSKLAEQGLLPETIGWDASRVHNGLNAVILGMHAKADNPELLRAQELGIPVYSFPDFIRQQCSDKQRIVIAGSHGKTTITALIIHILNFCNKPFDYLVGAAVPGLDLTVRLSNAPIIIIEGDEYLTSPIDRVPKFLKYDHHIALISGIEWDHMNVFPTFEEYVKQFDLLADKTPKAGTLVYCEEDNLVTVICTKERTDVKTFEYKTHPHTINNGRTFLESPKGPVEVKIFGKHNMQNIAAAFALVQRIGITEEQCYAAIGSFKGAWKRQQLIAEKGTSRLFLDFAHAPSKVKATTKAVRKQFPDTKLVCALELHTFSSLNKEFLPQYDNKLESADVAIVFISPSTLTAKNLPEITEEELRGYFKSKNLELITDKEKLADRLGNLASKNTTFLMMSSGSFGGLDIQKLASQIIGQ